MPAGSESRTLSASSSSSDGKAKMINVRAAVIVGDLEEEQNGVQAGKFRRVENFDGFDCPRLGAEPALTRQISR